MVRSGNGHWGDSESLSDNNTERRRIRPLPATGDGEMGGGRLEKF